MKQSRLSRVKESKNLRKLIKSKIKEQYEIQNAINEIKQEEKENKVVSRNERRQKSSNERMKEDGTLIRLSTLLSMVLLLRTEVNRIMAEVENILDDNDLVAREIKYDINAMHNAEDRFFKVMKTLMQGVDAEDYLHDSDRFDVDFYNYMGVRYKWAPYEPSMFSAFVGSHNIMHANVTPNLRKTRMLISRDKEGKLYIAKNDDKGILCRLPNDWFKNIKKRESLYVDIVPILKNK